MGGKYKLLPQILELFPPDISTFVDLFRGGFNVGINTKADKIIYNDISPQVTSMLRYFNENNFNEMLGKIDGLIKKYRLSKTNQDGYLRLRELYNNNKNSRHSSIILYVLICYAFNNQIRFNSKGEYNMPFGKARSSFNLSLREKFCSFVGKLQNSYYEFICGSFREFDFSNTHTKDFIYCDPPYYNSIASYNENGGWTEKEENDLLGLLNELNSRGIRFALSNNLTTNPALERWSYENGYYIKLLNHSYGNCNYQKKNKSGQDLEVLIRNYK